MRLVFLLDLDNTLLDVEGFKADLNEAIVAAIGEAGAAAFWREYEAVRHELGQVDVEVALRRVRGPSLMALTAAQRVADRLLPGARDAVAAMTQLGLPVIVTDGEERLQRLKIDRSGLGAVVGGRVVVCPHKEEQIDAIVARYPADRYVMVDDKASLLAAFKAALGARVVTVHVRHGRYAVASPATPPDYTIDGIADLIPLLPRLSA